MDVNMQDYSIYLLDERGRVSLAFDFHGIDDLAALDESGKHSDKNAVEIWQRSRLVARIDQGQHFRTAKQLLARRQNLQ
jgi:hypothetical protein